MFVHHVNKIFQNCGLKRNRSQQSKTQKLDQSNTVGLVPTGVGRFFEFLKNRWFWFFKDSKMK